MDFYFIPTSPEYVGSGPIGNDGTMSTAGAAQLTAGLNGPASGLSQIVRRFTDASMFLPRGSTGAAGPMFGGLSIVSSSKKRALASTAKHARLAGRLRQLRNKVQHHLRKTRRRRHRQKKRSHARPKNVDKRHKHVIVNTKGKRRHLKTTETYTDDCKIDST